VTGRAWPDLTVPVFYFVLASNHGYSSVAFAVPRSAESQLTGVPSLTKKETVALGMEDL
jgi:hypothetical protein